MDLKKQNREVSRAMKLDPGSVYYFQKGTGATIQLKLPVLTI